MPSNKFIVGTGIVGVGLFIVAFFMWRDIFRNVHAQETQEIAPYKFADETQEVAPYKFTDLPHGRIYKAVHEGCELYIVESDWITKGAYENHTYVVSTARGCH